MENRQMKEPSKQKQLAPRLMTCGNKCQLSSSLLFKITLKNIPIKKNNTQGKLEEQHFKKTASSERDGDRRAEV